MQIPLEIVYKDVNKSDFLDELIRAKVSRLEKVCDYITSCRVAVEKPHSTTRKKNSYRVRISVNVPSNHEVVTAKESSDDEKEEPITSVIRSAFSVAERQLKKLVQLQRQKIKKHPEQEVRALVTRLFPEEGYGFIRTINGREIYFHKNAVVNSSFERIQEGMGVRFYEEDGEKGPQASTIQIID